MSRDSGGVYSLPAGNPVITGTTITVAWANGTLNDIASALTDSLSRSGFGAMTGVLQLAAGNVSAPGLAFSLEPTSGIYREAAGQVSVSILGVKVARFSAASLAVTGALSATTSLSAGTTLSVTGVATFLASLRSFDGTAGTPAYSFTSDTNTGFYSPSADEIGFSLGGTAYLVGFRNIPQNIQNGNYTLVLTDAAKHIYKASGAGNTLTIPANASVAFPIGTPVTFINQSGNTVSIAITTDTMTMMGTGATGTRTLANNGIATATKVSATSWVISGAGLT